jgi:hypothetical protein
VDGYRERISNFRVIKFGIVRVCRDQARTFEILVWKEIRMKKNERIVLKISMMLVSTGFLFGCGINSNSSSVGSGAGGSGPGFSRPMSPGEMTRLQNQNNPGASPEELEAEQKDSPEGQTSGFYNDLASKNPAVKKTAEQALRNLVVYDPQYLAELQKLQIANTEPDAWFEVQQIIKEGEKAKAKQLDDEVKAQLATSQADDTASN